MLFTWHGGGCCKDGEDGGVCVIVGDCVHGTELAQVILVHCVVACTGAAKIQFMKAGAPPHVYHQIVRGSKSSAEILQCHSHTVPDNGTPLSIDRIHVQY